MIGFYVIIQLNPIRSGVFEKVNDSGGGGGVKSPPPITTSKTIVSIVTVPCMSI